MGFTTTARSLDAVNLLGAGSCETWPVFYTFIYFYLFLDFYTFLFLFSQFFPSPFFFQATTWPLRPSSAQGQREETLVSAPRFLASLLPSHPTDLHIPFRYGGLPRGAVSVASNHSGCATGVPPLEFKIHYITKFTIYP